MSFKLPIFNDDTVFTKFENIRYILFTLAFHYVALKVWLWYLFETMNQIVILSIFVIRCYLSMQRTMKILKCSIRNWYYKWLFSLSDAPKDSIDNENTHHNFRIHGFEQISRLEMRFIWTCKSGLTICIAFGVCLYVSLSEASLLNFLVNNKVFVLIKLALSRITKLQQLV